MRRQDKPSHMNCKLLLVIVGASSLCRLAMAQTVTLDCGAANDPMTVRYCFDRPTAQARAHSVDLNNQIRPKVCPKSGPCMVTAEIPKVLTCRKPQGVFRFKIKPVAFNADRQAQCGARVTGQLSILLNGTVVLAPTDFEDVASCYKGDDASSISSITVKPDGGKPILTRTR